MTVPTEISFPMLHGGNLIYRGISPQCLLDFITLLNHDGDLQQWLIESQVDILAISIYNIRVYDQPKSLDDTGLDTPDRYPLVDVFQPLDEATIRELRESLHSGIREHIESTIPTQKPITPEFSHITPDTHHSIQVMGGSRMSSPFLNILVSAFLYYIFRDHTATVIVRRVYRITESLDFQLAGASSSIPPGPAPSRLPTRKRMNWRRTALQINTVDNDTDRIPRRIVFLVTLVSKFFQCFVKASNNLDYTNDYILEAEVYDYFRSVRQDPDSTEAQRQASNWVTEFHGSGLARRSGTTLPINLELGGGRTKQKACKISLEGLRYTPLPNLFFYLATGFDIDYVAFGDVIRARHFTAIHKGFTTIVTTLGQLNREFRFFHGDLHPDNMLIHTDQTRCKCFDFDFSGCLGRPELENMKVLRIHSPNHRVYLEFAPLYTENSDKFAGFLSFYDTLRLWIGIVLTMNIPHELLPGLDITIQNVYLEYNTTDILDEIKKLPEYQAYIPSADDTTPITIHNFMRWLRSNQPSRDIYNRYFCNLARVWNMYQNICAKYGK